MASQRARIEGYCSAHGLELVDAYEDDGISAYQDVHRPEFERMKADMDAWDVCIATSLDRFWRNSLKAGQWIAELGHAKKDFVAIDNHFDTSTATGRFTVRIFMDLAELQSEQTSERVHASLDSKFDNDRFGWNTKAPYGYDLEGKRGTAHLVINPFESEGITMAFKLIRKHSLLDVALAMNRAGHKTKRGNPFNERAVMHIVHNPVYAGYCYRNNVLRKNEHEHIIPDDLFNEVQVALIKRRRGRNPRTQAPLVVGDKVIRAERVNANGGYYKPL